MPVDADTRNSEEADIQNVSVNSFLALTENTGVPLNIIILDAQTGSGNEHVFNARLPRASLYPR